jgi:hypothetical protein
MRLWKSSVLADVGEGDGRTGAFLGARSLRITDYRKLDSHSDNMIDDHAKWSVTIGKHVSAFWVACIITGET